VKTLMTDPIVLVCGGIIIFGFVGLILAVRSLLGGGKSGAASRVEDDIADAVSALRDSGLESLPIPPLAAPQAAPVAPVISHEVADRLDSMTQRLSEMQAVLQKQAAAASAAPAAAASSPAPSVAGVGQGFSPATIDKLLKIVANVIQQVDVLQKGLTTPLAASKESGGPSTPPLVKI
jgi:hypothetical protein